MVRFPVRCRRCPDSGCSRCIRLFFMNHIGGAIFSDCVSVVDGFAQGPHHPATVSCLHSTLWKGIFDRAVSKQVRVAKAIAHFTDVDVVAGRLAPRQNKANDFVDWCAKLGAAQHAVSKQFIKDQKQFFRTSHLVGLLRVRIIVLTSPNERPALKGRRSYRKRESESSRSQAFCSIAMIAKCGPSAPFAIIDGSSATQGEQFQTPRRHQPFPLDGGFARRVSGVCARTKGSIISFVYAECAGDDVTRLSASTLHPDAPIIAGCASSHRLAVIGSITWRKVC